MKNKIYSFSFLLSFALITLTAIAHSNIAVKYDMKGRGMILVTSPERSLFYDKMSLYVDSCMSTPEGALRFKEAQNAALRVEHPDGTVTMDGWKYHSVPMKNQYLYVDKDFSKGEMTVYDFTAGHLTSYEEPLSEMKWKIIGDSTQNILGYECIMAISDYHGRNWKAWFTPEIAVQDGPWKLHGLPGIILEADGGDGFFIKATEVGSTSQDVPSVYSTDQYEKGERKKILAEHEYYENNLESIMSAQGIKLNGDGSPANLPKFDRQHQAWERDY